MKKIIFFFLVGILLIQISNTHWIQSTSITNSKSIGKLIFDGDITGEYKDLTNSVGQIYGGQFYLYNSSNKTLRVSYSLTGYVNVYIQSSGGIIDIPPHTKIWAITVTAYDVTKAWDPGTINYEW